MYIKSIELSNFRNYEYLSMEFHPEKNILYGDNAQGKTNILEALYYCGMMKSHKGSKEKEIIKKHMWPLTFSPPKYLESFIVTIVDKYCAFKEWSMYCAFYILKIA